MAPVLGFSLFASVESGINQSCRLQSKPLAGLHFEATSQEGGEWIPARLGPVPGQIRLDGVLCEQFHLGGAAFGASGLINFVENEQWVVGSGRITACPATLEEAAFSLYNELFAVVANRSIYRVWNFVSNINRMEPLLPENYKLFCSGRARAFAGLAGETGSSRLPAASATGRAGAELTVFFLAGNYPAVDWENPEQVPAYQYPPEYGPRSPSFSRATRVACPDGEWIFVSGTAAIKGSSTQFPGEFRPQLEVTLDNLDLILRSAGQVLSHPAPGSARHFRIYLRRRENLAELRERLQRGILAPGDTWIVVEADICRKELEVEIELMVYPRTCCHAAASRTGG